MPNPVPGKGEVLTRMSAFWFGKMADIIPNHVVSTNPDEYPAVCAPYRDLLRGRSMLVKKAKPLPVEKISPGTIALFSSVNVAGSSASAAKLTSSAAPSASMASRTRSSACCLPGSTTGGTSARSISFARLLSINKSHRPAQHHSPDYRPSLGQTHSRRGRRLYRQLRRAPRDRLSRGQRRQQLAPDPA